MGRSGGGGGGGRSGGGFSSGGRSSGSFSGGSRGHSSTSFGGRSSNKIGSSYSSSKNYSSGHRSSNYGSTKNSFNPVIFLGKSSRFSPSVYDEGNHLSKKKENRYQGLIISLVIFIVTAILCVPLIFNSLNETFGKSDISREPLPTSYAEGTGFYTDEDGDWIYNNAKLSAGMREFYNNTGVWPYVYILKNGSETNSNNLKVKAENLYDDLFNDEAHFLMVFCDDNEGGYNWGYCVGADAKTIMDQDALVTMNNYLERNYNNLNISEEEIFSNTFRSTSERIMGLGSSNIFSYLTLIIGLIIIAAAIALVIRQIVILNKQSKEEAEKEKNEKLNKILSKPLEKFSDNELDEIASKYEEMRV